MIDLGNIPPLHTQQEYEVAIRCYNTMKAQLASNIWIGDRNKQEVEAK